MVSTQLDLLAKEHGLAETPAKPDIIEPKSPEHGDFATNYALVHAKSWGSNPRDLAQKLAQRMESLAEVDSAEVAGPGFVNFRLAAPFITRHLSEVLERGPSYVQHHNPNPRKINVEFVSVNPNGPITVGSGRGAALGDSLCRVLRSAGHQVSAEYYINDGVNSEQMRLFGLSVQSLFAEKLGLQIPFPESGYKGTYVSDVADSLLGENLALLGPLKQALAGASADQLLAEYLGVVNTDRDSCKQVREWIAKAYKLDPLSAFDSAHIAANQDLFFQKVSQEAMLERQKEDLKLFGVEFETWFSEQSLHDSNEVLECLEDLQKMGVADREPLMNALVNEDGKQILTQEVQPEGALWLRSTRFGDDKDRVLIRQDGRPTYIASDVAYHRSKFQRGYDEVIDIFGPDHHGYIGRMKAVVQSLGISLDRFEVIIYQLVRFLKEGQPAPMRKRDGNIYELRDLIQELGAAAAADRPAEEQLATGRDVARFFYLMRSHDSRMDFDIDLATSQSEENPVFYAQYAHARICSIFRKAAELNLAADPLALGLLNHPKELALIKKVCDLPSEVLRSADDYGVHRLATYSVELGRTFHGFYDNCRVLDSANPELSRARLALCEGAKSALVASLNLLGVSTPEEMHRQQE
ncbi:MAG: arginine--tRNA ligase [Fimbriimonadaceae bacterium]